MMLSHHVTSLTGLMGRWQQLESSPRLICDTGHNTGGIQYIVRQLQNESYQNLRIIIGMVNDKDISGVLANAPPKCRLLFHPGLDTSRFTRGKTVRISNKSRIDREVLSVGSTSCGSGEKESRPDDLIFVGGSTFIVADLLKTMLSQQ